MVITGSARLPSPTRDGRSSPLLLAVVVDASDGRIAEVHSNISLSAYNELLSTVLVGKLLDGIGRSAEEFAARCRGPLVKPTLAALANVARQLNLGLH
ncbi:MAG: DUF3870 domain-containing protein [Phenylobacterium sp.]|nr:DUF3870 domain-containing protein [Phenylobacterium sp.]